MRTHLNRHLLPVAMLAASLFAAAARPQAVNFVDVKPSPQQVAWQDLEFGILIHFGTNTFLNREWGDGTADPTVFNPAQADPEQWVAAAQAAGARYIILVAKHHDGFCLWPTDQTPYSVKASPWLGGKGDLVRMTAEAARKHGLRFGVYLSPWDRHEPRYKDSAAYDLYYQAELEELATRYGQLVEFWLDGAGSAGHVYNFAKYVETLRTYQPNTLIFADTGLLDYGDIRWVGNESGLIDYENWNVIDRHGLLRWRPVEADTPLRREHWFWHPNDEASLKSVDELVTTWEQTVGRGGQLVLGLAPDNRGLLPESDVARLREFGSALRARYGRNLAQAHLPTDANMAAALDGDEETFWQAPAEARTGAIEVQFSKPVRVDRAVALEWLNEGQRVESYVIEAWRNGAWKRLVSGQAIGHRKVDAFPAVTASRFRLRILSGAGSIRIREFQLFDSGVEGQPAKTSR